jgi:hypothetical protein
MRTSTFPKALAPTATLLPIVTHSGSRGPMRTYVAGAAEQLLAIRPPGGDRQDAEIVWRRPGRGMGVRRQAAHLRLSRQLKEIH